MTNKLFQFGLRVRDGSGPAAKRVIVVCFASAPDADTAVKDASGKLVLERRLVIEALEGTVREVPVDRFGDFIQATTPGMQHDYPSPEALPALVEAGTLFFGPQYPVADA